MESSRGSQEVDILELARLQQRVVVTFDNDFGELVFRHGLPNAGVILLRFQASSRDELQAKFEVAWPQVQPHAINHFVVISERKIRIRPLRIPLQ
jgi:predicted nuclease of predicted toxin-antitoxin system